MRRGFTVIEVVLAFTVGTIVVGSALTLMASLDRTDARLQRRHEQRMQLAIARTSLQRAMTTLVMDDSPQNQKDVLNPPPRFLLTESASPGAVRLFNRARLLGVDMGEPQRLEVVLSRPPTPNRGASSLQVSEVEDDLRLDVQEQRVTFRGAFELWPDNTAPGSAEAEQAWSTTSGMTLWWIPMVEDASAVAPPVAVASGLVSCQWQVFHESERKSAFEATYLVELPGYVEFEARTNADIHVNWMFEIMWTEGPEIAVADAGGDLADDARGDGSGGDGTGADSSGADRSGGARGGRPSSGGSTGGGSTGGGSTGGGSTGGGRGGR